MAPPVRSLLCLLAASTGSHAEYWDNQCTACPASLWKDKHCLKGGTLIGERGCGGIFCEGHCSDPEESPAPLPDQRYWDGVCKPCPAKMYESQHCQDGGVLLGERGCGVAGAFCEGHCSGVRTESAPPAEFYWDGQCTLCPASFYKEEHCLQGGELVDARACGPLGLRCEGKCRKPQSSPAPEPKFYWDGKCTACPAGLYSDSHCSKGGKLVGERSCNGIGCEGHCELAADAPEPADWIVVGAGASGCAAAAALADAGLDVLVLERGKSDMDIPSTQAANTWPHVVNTEAAEMIRWEDGTWGAVANVLGGGTEINGGLYIEEQPDFFEESFGSDFDVEAFYESSATIASSLASPLKGSAYGDAYTASLAGLGMGSGDPPKSVRMLKNSSWIAYSTLDTEASGWPRKGAAVLLHERSGLKNLRFLTEFHVSRIRFEGNRAVGVDVRTPQGDSVTVEARKGVILAAGAIYTPQLLQLSGIGDEELMSRLGVETVVKNAEVGRNFVDRNLLNFGAWSGKHSPLFVGYSMASSTTYNLTLENEGWGKVASAFTIASLGLVPPDQRTPLLRAVVTPLLEGPLASIMDSMIQFVALQHQTFSRGSVEARSRDATQPPRVSANKLSDPRDLENQLVAMQVLSSIVETGPVQEYVNPKTFEGTSEAVPAYLSCINHARDENAKAVVLPCLPENGASKEEYFDYFRRNVVSSYHYFSTASHGSVVEGQDFRVSGTENLHIVDASVFPHPTRVNPQGTIMAMGHYVGSRLAKETRRLQEAGDTAEVYV